MIGGLRRKNGSPVTRRLVQALLSLALTGGAILKLAATAAAAGMIWIHLCGSYTPGSGSNSLTLGVAHSGTSNGGVTTPFGCPPSSSGSNPYGMEVFGGRERRTRRFACVLADRCSSRTRDRRCAHRGFRGWSATASTRTWAGAAASTGRVAVRRPPGAGRLQLAAAVSRPTSAGRSSAAGAHCNGTTKPGEISILGLELEGAEGSGPTVSVAAGSLGAASGWVRGSWPIGFSADGPTGACRLSASLAGASVSQPLNEPQSQITWHQCPAGSFSQSFNTAAVASGPGVPLVMWARDAAYDYGAGHYCFRPGNEQCEHRQRPRRCDPVRVRRTRRRRRARST